ncbi:MAG: serine/threonine protein kinase [Muribaculaceae bacterium]|nr:serine/threonine protein kinase [Muribaculaceae bacterium]
MNINGLAPGTILKGEKYEYEIHKVLGSGSFGITYVAMMKSEDGSLPVAVALKEFFMREINGRDGSTVSNSTANNVFGYYKKKFIKEALSLGRLNHPGIIKVIESFEANNTCYYSMEYIRGGSLEDLIERKGSLGEAETVALAIKIGEALEYMHSKNMVHLDLKPGNIMMRDGQTPVLIDFGLSKKFDAEGHAETSTTLGCGTPGYSPIEQATQQKTDELPVTMDIYAFGATMFKMLTGKRPPESSSILNDGFPSRALKNIGLSRRLINVVEKSMSPSKKNRFQRINDVLYAIRPLKESHEKTIIDNTKQQTPDNQQKKRKSVSRWFYVNILLSIYMTSGFFYEFSRLIHGKLATKNCTIYLFFFSLSFVLYLLYLNKLIYLNRLKKSILCFATIFFSMGTLMLCISERSIEFGLLIMAISIFATFKEFVKQRK